ATAATGQRPNVAACVHCEQKLAVIHRGSLGHAHVARQGKFIGLLFHAMYVERVGMRKFTQITHGLYHACRVSIMQGRGVDPTYYALSQIWRALHVNLKDYQ
ncbi:hypothetical protein Tco_0943297, partial [Tanacetum coccineum]